VFARGEAPPALVVFVDAWTKYGGSQFVDSPGTGRYHSYLCDEVVPWVDAHYRTLAAGPHRAITGKSSGGFGAMITPMLRPDLFGALGTHSGDALYEYSYIPEFAKAARYLREYDGDIWRWWDGFQSRTSFTKPEEHDLLMLLGVSACFSANKDGSVELPFDPDTGQLRPDVWQRWLDWDPVRMAPQYADALAAQRGIWIDAGTRDEWFLDLGAKAFRESLRGIGVGDDVIQFELFDGTHMGIDYSPRSTRPRRRILADQVEDASRARRRRAARPAASMAWQPKVRAGTDGFDSSLIIIPIVVTISLAAWLIAAGASR
jgi:hypothetical protein